MTTETTRDALEAAHELLNRITGDCGLWAMSDAVEVRDQLRAALAEPRYPIPGPYEIALAVGAALAGSGRYETPGAAMAAAWMSVPEFYQARDRYLAEMVPAMLGAWPAADNDGQTPYDARA